MPPIKPLNQDLLLAPPTQTSGDIPNPNQESGVQSPPVQRRLTIYYQNGSATPVAPQIDNQTDIAKSIVNRYAEYLGDQTKINNIPVLGLPVEPVGFSNQDPQPGQLQHINNFPQEAETELKDYPTITGENVIKTPDKRGINFKNSDPLGPRNFRLNQYEQNINLEGATLHQQNIDRVLLETRGHNDVPSNKFITQDITNNKADGRITLGSFFYKNAAQLGNSVNYATGSYVRDKNVPQASTMTIEQMKDIGLNIMFEAAQGQAGFDFKIKSNDPTATIQAEARMALPSEQRLGKRVKLGRFTPAYQIRKLTDGNVEKSTSQNFIDNTDDIDSYGSFYNAYNQFDALVPTGQIALAVALILAFVTLLSGIAAILQAQSPSPTTKEQTSGGFIFGGLSEEEKLRLRGTAVLQNNAVYPSANIGAGEFFTQFFGTNSTLNYTKHTWTQCLTAGIQEFFGFAFLADTGTTVGQQAVNSSLKVLTESGRLNVVLREILRSGITLVETVTANPEQLGSITNAGNLIRKIRDLKIVRFINVLLTIGDRVRFEGDLHQSAQLNRNVGGGSFGASGSISYVDSLPDNRAFYISKSRLSDGRGLAWSNKTAGMTMLPLFLNSPKAFGRAGLRTDKYDTKYDTNWSDIDLTVRDIGDGYEQIVPVSSEEKEIAIQNDRLPASVVESVEKALESDYMPFYIHDLRTNEILSFHAFLEDANEDFAVEYSAQEGYGRMDKIQIYKGTTRNISVNFKMIATNKDDHDLMWYKINRLAMMIYPQWTQGRKVSVGQNINFIQPFSQIPGATPVIRLRLGDLYKSNYSKMAVTRLFGITTLEDYNVNGNVTQPRVTSTAPVPDKPTTERVSNIRNRARNLRSGKSFASLGNNVPPPAKQRQSVSLETITPEDCFATDDVIFLNNSQIGILPIAPSDSNTSSLISALQSINSNQRLVGKYLGRTPRDNNAIQIRIEQFIPDINNVVNLQPFDQPYPNFTVTIDALNQGAVDRERTAQILEQQNQILPLPEQEEQEPNNEDLLTPSKFFDETKNPVMKAFKSNGGKGLAGVITSFKIDYGESKGVWGIDGADEYLRAPKFVTVQLTMAVIHDITPGLDARGIMNAPIWPVGKRSNFFMNNGPQQSTGNTEPASGQPVTNGYTGNQNYFQNLRYINRKG